MTRDQTSYPHFSGGHFFHGVVYSFIAVVLLYYGKSLFIPLSFALLISLVLYPFCKWMENHKVPRSASIFVGLSTFLVGLVLVVGLLLQQFVSFLKEWNQLKQKVFQSVEGLKNTLEQWDYGELIGNDGFLVPAAQYLFDHLLPGLPRALYQSSVSAVLLILIPVYVALILYYRNTLVAFLYSIFPERNHQYITNVLPDVIVTYYNFIKGMIIIYVIVGVLNSVGLAVIGIPNPVFFGFVASILTFIPYVGITIGALLPMAVSWLKYDSLWYPAGVVIIFVIVQILEANIIFPLVVSNRLKINALIALIVIIAGGIIWGAAGMILFLPFIAILKLISDQVDEMKPFSILLGGNNG